MRPYQKASGGRKQASTLPSLCAKLYIEMVHLKQSCSLSFLCLLFFLTGCCSCSCCSAAQALPFSPSFQSSFPLFSTVLPSAHPHAAEPRSSRMTAAEDATVHPPPLALCCLSLASAFPPILPPPSLIFPSFKDASLCLSRICKIQQNEENRSCAAFFKPAQFSSNTARYRTISSGSFVLPLPLLHSLFNTLNVVHELF